jgi:hypothetical protein
MMSPKVTGQRIGTPDDDGNDLVWGAREIGKLWGIADIRAVYWKLANNRLPGVRRIGRQYCASRRARREAFNPPSQATP